MAKYFILTIILLSTFSGFTQDRTLLQIKPEEDTEGALVVIPSLKIALITGKNGIAEINQKIFGKYTLSVKLIGYEEFADTVSFGLQDTIQIILKPVYEEIGEIEISSTRSSRTFKEIPTRVEFISEEELEEKANMKPGDIRMMLSESTGIQTQTTSPSSANATIRIQGLDGRYTQMLRDGFPLYSGAAGNLGLLQTPPLDLKQAEIIKGSSSTLYGGGAIAGLVNLISKTPDYKKEFKAIINATSARGLDVSVYHAARNLKLGHTVLATWNSNEAYNPSQTVFSAIPQFRRITLFPKFYIYKNENTTMWAGVQTIAEERTGGNMAYINRDTLNGVFFEKNRTLRNTIMLNGDHKFGVCSHINFKFSASNFQRELRIPNFYTTTLQDNIFSEISYSNHGEKTEWIAGMNFLFEQVNIKNNENILRREIITYRIPGIFIQNTTRINENFHIESGLRTDYFNFSKPIVLPRVSLLYKINTMLSSRIGGGMGYKTPQLFTEETERIFYRNFTVTNILNNKPEQSRGVNWDINYKTTFFDDELLVSINQLFYFTEIENPLLLNRTNANLFELKSVGGKIQSRGFETNLKLVYDDFKFFGGYTFNEVYTYYNSDVTLNILCPRHRINAVLMYEKDDDYKIGLEAYYFGKQLLSDGLFGRHYIIPGLMAEKIYERWSIYLNFENFIDTRQTNFDTIYIGSSSNPMFRDIYAPLDGFVMNAGVKLKLR